MKILAALALAILLSSCVTRTVRDEHGNKQTISEFDWRGLAQGVAIGLDGYGRYRNPATPAPTNP